MIKALNDLEQRDDGEFEIIDIKIDSRKTKSLENAKTKTASNISEVKIDKPNTNLDNKNFNKSSSFIKNIDEAIGKRFSMPDRRKGYIKKQQLEIIKYIYTLVSMRMEKLGNFYRHQ